MSWSNVSGPTHVIILSGLNQLLSQNPFTTNMLMEEFVDISTIWICRASFFLVSAVRMRYAIEIP
jgi:hypothetical protein